MSRHRYVSVNRDRGSIWGEWEVCERCACSRRAIEAFGWDCNVTESIRLATPPDSEPTPEGHFADCVDCGKPIFDTDDYGEIPTVCESGEVACRECYEKATAGVEVAESTAQDVDGLIPQPSGLANNASHPSATPEGPDASWEKGGRYEWAMREVERYLDAYESDDPEDVRWLKGARDTIDAIKDAALIAPTTRPVAEALGEAS